MKKRIALVGNMNNNFFALARYLRDEGYDAHLFYRLAMEHFQPKADTYSDDYISYCHEVHWLDKGFHNADKENVRSLLKGFDFYIGQGEEAAVAYACGFNMDVYYPYGSDVYKYAQLPLEYSIPSKLVSVLSKDASRPTYKQMQEGTMAKHLRGVIAHARYILAEPTNASFETQLNKLQYKGQYEKVALPFIYTKEYETKGLHVPANENINKMLALRQQYDFIVLYHGRQEWKTYHNDFTGKNTDHLINGFAQYLKQHPQAKTCLVLLDYGTDVPASKELIDQLGIAKYVYWIPKMYRKELMYLVAQADICCGEFNRSYLTFGTVIEAMLMKKPVINYREDALYADVYPELYPCYIAREADQIATAIGNAAGNPVATSQMGAEASKWVMNYFIEKPLQRLFNIIESAA